MTVLWLLVVGYVVSLVVEIWLVFYADDEE